MTLQPGDLPIQTAAVFVPLLQPARYKGAWGGRGSGKSHFFAESVVERCVLQQGTRIVCIREVQKSLAQSAKLLVEDKIRKIGVSGFRILSDRIEAPGDGLILFQGMQNHTADSIKSLEGFDVAWWEEAQNASNRSMGLLRPTIRKDNSELWFSWNPGKMDAPVEFLRVDPPPNAIVVKVNYEDNPWFPTVLQEEMEYDKRRDPARYAHVWLGAFITNTEAQVFRNWKVDTMEVPADARPYYGADWGFSVDPTVLIRCYILDRTIYIDKEAYKVGCEIDRTPELFKTVPGAAEWPITADSARPETISYMQKRGWNITPARKGIGSLEEGVEFLKSYDIVVNPDCRHVIDEMTLYAWKTDRLTDEILPLLEDRHNHTIDAIRYALENVRRRTSVYAAKEAVVSETPATIPGLWQRVAGAIIDHKACTVVWAAYNRMADTIHVYDIYTAPRTALAIHAEAIRARGRWIPVVMAEPERSSERDEAARIAFSIADLGLDLVTAPFDLRAAVEATTSRLATGRLRAAEHLDEWFRQYRAFGRDDKGEIVVEGQEIMRATAIIVALGINVAVTENAATSAIEGYDRSFSDMTRNPSTGY